MTLQQPPLWVKVSQKRFVRTSVILRLFVCSYMRGGKIQRKSPEVCSVKAVEFISGDVAILSHIASTAEYWLAFDSLHHMFLVIFFLPV